MATSDWIGFGNLVIACLAFFVAAVALWLAKSQLKVAVDQLKDSAVTAKADFAHRLKNDFFDPSLRDIRDLIEFHLITFKSDKGKDPVFIVDRVKARSKLPAHSALKESYSTSEVDDFIGILEDIGYYLDSNRIRIEDVYYFFSYYISAVEQDLGVHEYLAWQRSQKDQADVFKYLPALFRAVNAEAELREEERNPNQVRP